MNSFCNTVFATVMQIKLLIVVVDIDSIVADPTFYDIEICEM